jgi:hypothetical protein
MSRAYSLIVVAVVGLVLAVPAWAQEHGQAGPQEHRQIRAEVSGYSLNLNPGGTMSGVRGFNLLEAKSTQGPALATGAAPTYGPPSPSGPYPEWCPQQLPVVVFLPMVTGGDIGLRFRASGDLLLLKSAPDPIEGLGICIHKNADMTGGWYEGRGAGSVVSGTGRFEGVTGTFEARYGGRFFTPNFSDATTIFETTLRISIDK